MSPATLHTGTVRLVDRKTRVVELFGPEPPASRRPTDRELLFDRRASYLGRPQPVGYCFQADGRRAKFLVDKGPDGDALLDLLARHPRPGASGAAVWGQGLAGGGMTEKEV